MVQSVNRNLIVTNDGRKYEKPSKKRIAAGIYAGQFAGIVAGIPILMVCQQPFKSSMQNIRNMTTSETGELNSLGKEIQLAAKEAFEKSGLQNSESDLLMLKKLKISLILINRFRKY